METNNTPNARSSSVLPTHLSTASKATQPRRTPRRDLLVEEALAWLRHARARAHSSGRHALSDEAITAKSLEALKFTLSLEADHFDVPSKLVGTKAHQDALRALVREGLPFGARLDVIARGEALTVWHGRWMLGAVQAKHVPWLRPLLERGAAVRLLEVTGHDDPRKTLGVNICFSHVGLASLRAEHALDRVAASGDGATSIEEASAGDGVPEVVKPSVVTPSVVTTAQPPAIVPPIVLPLGHPATHRLDVVLYRSGSTAHATVPHACYFSKTGIEWGYRGSGPADLALSVLCRFTDVALAESLYRDFLEEVVARVPYGGARLSAPGIAAWIARHRDGRHHIDGASRDGDAHAVDAPRGGHGG